MARKAKPTTVSDAVPVGQAAWLSYCQDLEDWPRTWMVWPEDLSSGQKIVESFKPFLQYLSQLSLSKKTVRKHVDNLWILGGEIIRDLHETPSLRKVPVEDLVLDVVKEEGPLLYHCDSEAQQGSFASTCRKLRRFVERQPR